MVRDLPRVPQRIMSAATDAQRPASFLQRVSRWGALATLLAVMLSTILPTANAQLQDLEDLLGAKSKSGAAAKPKFSTTLTTVNGQPVDTAKPGDEVTLTLAVTLPKGYYIYGTDGEFGGRTMISLKETGLVSTSVWIPEREPKKTFEPVFKVEVSKFHDRVTWKKTYRLADDADPANVRVMGELSGQYCSDGKDGTGECVPIIPAYEFNVALAQADGGKGTEASAGNNANETATGSPVLDYAAHAHKGKNKPVILRFELSPSNAKPGDKVTLRITAKMDQGWHTFSLTQNGPGGSATEIEIENTPGLKPLGEGFVAIPAFEIEEPEPGLKQEIHNGLVTWSRSFEVLPEAEQGQYGTSGTITLQACKSSCLPPRAVPFTLPFTGDLDPVLNPPKPEDYLSSNAPDHGTSTKVDAGQNNKPNPPEGANGKGAKRPQDQGLFAFLLTAIGFGFVSLLTPCVFPMVPITVSFFLKQSESQHNRPLLMALVFCGSIVATFTILGVGIAAIFGAAQLNALANNPWLNIAIGFVFVVFAFNMLGLFEIRIPSSLLTFTSSHESAGGYVGAVFMALTFTLTSFTCTFAFAGTLLVAAAQGQYFWPILGMMAFGAAFASPFFVLALVPSLLKKLPKSGGWMNVVKVVMGLIELGAAVKFFSVADLAWNNIPVIFDYAGVMVAWTVLSLLITLYLLGGFRLPHDTPSHGISVGRLTMAMIFLGLSGMLTVGVLAPERGGGWIMDQIIAFAPPRFDEPAPQAHAGDPNLEALPEPTISHHGIRFMMDVDKAITLAKEKQQPMLFDFTGVNCINCRLMEKKLSQPEIRQRLTKLLLVQLYADKVPLVPDAQEAKRLLKRNIELQTKWFEDVTLPSYAVVTPDGKTILSSYFGLEQKDGEFAAFLDEGWKKWQELK